MGVATHGWRLAISLTAISLWACSATFPEGSDLGRDVLAGPPAQIAPGAGPANPDPFGDGGGARRDPEIGTTCRSTDSRRLCLGIRYVAYKDATGTASPTQQDALRNLKAVNAVWNACDIAFQIDTYEDANPADYGLAYATSNYTELDDIRDTFGEDTSLLVVTTGRWNRAGTLGNTGANAWTAMPGGPPYGVVLERPVATYTNIIAHELGHYLNLNHVSDAAALMNPIIYTTSTAISAKDCASARSAAQFYWSRMLR